MKQLASVQFFFIYLRHKCEFRDGIRIRNKSDAGAAASDDLADVLLTDIVGQISENTKNCKTAKKRCEGIECGHDHRISNWNYLFSVRNDFSGHEKHRIFLN